MSPSPSMSPGVALCPYPRLPLLSALVPSRLAVRSLRSAKVPPFQSSALKSSDRP